MKIHVERILWSKADYVWRALKHSDTLLKVTKGLVHFEHNFPEFWVEGKTEQVTVYPHHIPLIKKPILLFGMPYEITFTEINETEHIMRTQEHGGPITRWDHTMRVEWVNDYSCRYIDEVEIEAGSLTGFVAWHAKRMYEKRQRQWRRLLDNGELCF